jgi:hypothetical protein
MLYRARDPPRTEGSGAWPKRLTAWSQTSAAFRSSPSWLSVPPPDRSVFERAQSPRRPGYGLRKALVERSGNAAYGDGPPRRRDLRIETTRGHATLPWHHAAWAARPAAEGRASGVLILAPGRSIGGGSQ